MIPRHDDPDDAEDVAGEALRRFFNGALRPLWRDAPSETHDRWRGYAKQVADTTARVIAERRARLKGEVG